MGALWTAEFYDGTVLSQKTNPHLRFGFVREKGTRLEKFTLHLKEGLAAAVRLSDGRFYLGPTATSLLGWFYPPNHAPSSTYTLYYARDMTGSLREDGRVVTRVATYTLGYTTTTGVIRVMQIRPDGSYDWLP